MLIRASGTVVLLCVGILLLSACGLPLLIPPAHPTIRANSFDVWEQKEDGALVPIGWGWVDGVADDIRLELHMLPSNCLAAQKLELAGRVVAGSPPSMHLTARQVGGEVLVLDANLRPQPIVYSVNTLPFHGSLSFDQGCTGPKTLKIVAGEEPYPFGSLAGISRSATNARIEIDEVLETTGTRPQSIYQVTAALHIKAGDCSADTLKDSELAMPTGSPHVAINFLMDNHSTVFAETAIDVLHPNAPYATRFTIHGGPCDGQTFEAALRHRY
jgi:hypothetical protein